MPLNVKSLNIEDKLNMLNNTGEFKKYPEKMLGKIAKVKVNPDNFLYEDEFIITSYHSNLPREIYLYGKKDTYNTEDNIYFNYWMDIFLKTIENGYLNYDKFEKNNSKYELTIGLPYSFRKDAYCKTWCRKNIIEFLSCLFDVKLEEIEYQQQDLLELMVA